MKANDAVGWVLALAVLAALKGWAFMIALGMLGISVGYWVSVGAAVLLTFALAAGASKPS